MLMLIKMSWWGTVTGLSSRDFSSFKLFFSRDIFRLNHIRIFNPSLVTVCLMTESTTTASRHLNKCHDLATLYKTQLQTQRSWKVSYTSPASNIIGI